jgi:hypothetical protein
MNVGPHGPHGPHGGLHAITPPRNGPHAYKISNTNTERAEAPSVWPPGTNNHIFLYSRLLVESDRAESSVARHSGETNQ